jgi:orotate phosphoribosyltransferase
LTSSGALKFADKPENYFKLKSGRMSPYFCNMASAVDSGRKISETAKAYASSLDGLDYTFLHGPAMKGIPLVAAMADEIYRSKKRVVEFGYDFKDARPEILGDFAIGKKLAEEKKDIRVLDKLQSTLVGDKDCNGWSVQRHTEELLKTVLDNFDPVNIDCVVGKAYGGIVPAALLVKRLWEEKKVDVRFAYDRISAKEYGVTSEKFFVGDIRDGDRVLVIDAAVTKLSGVFGCLTKDSRIVLVDDVITTGKAKRESRDKIFKEQLNARFSCVLVGVHRSEVDEQGRSVESALGDLGLSLKYIVTAPQIFEYAREKKLVNDAAYANFQSYMKQYGGG